MRIPNPFNWLWLPLVMTLGCGGTTQAPGTGTPEPPVASTNNRAGVEIPSSVPAVVSDTRTRYAIMVSVDGLAAWLVAQMLDEGSLPTLARLRQEGASTLMARADTFNTSTIPNHTCMLTGLPSGQPEGYPDTAFHGYTLNVDPPENATLHNLGNPALAYVPSVFEVAHDRGLKTCLFASKSKFVIYQRSYDQDHGAPDRVGEDNGRNKIDRAVLDADTERLVESLMAELRTAPCRLTFLHLADPDAMGHQYGWGSSRWKEGVIRADKLIGALLLAVERHPDMRGHTALIVTADHGGVENNHEDITRKENFAIPFFLFGPGVPAGKDLYDVYAKSRRPPGETNPAYTVEPPPIRNGDLGNLALSLLGLPPIPGSVIKGMTR